MMSSPADKLPKIYGFFRQNTLVWFCKIVSRRDFMNNIFDTHAHYDDEAFAADRDEVI